MRCVLIGLISVCLLFSRQASADRPNVLFLFADDQAFDTVRATGNSEIQTPNIDRLVAQGTTFTHAFNQGGWHGAVCVASRTMMVTGLNLWNARRAESDLNTTWVSQHRLWPQLMSSRGYQTFFSGKWHVKAPVTQLFDVVRHVRKGMPQQTESGYNRPSSEDDRNWLPWDRSRGGYWDGGKHWSEVLADDGVDYLKMAADDERPFFMYLAFNAPHDPRQSPQEFVDRYPAEQLQLPANFLTEYPWDIGSNRIRDEQLAPFPRTKHAVKVHRQEYYAIITHMDHQIGRILTALEETGQADNTWIFFTADHGLACGQHGLLGKQNMYDHSVRVPFVICGPGVPQGARNGHRIYLQSVMATSLELAGGPVPEHVQFESLMQSVKQSSSEVTGTVSAAYVDVQRMVTVGKHKLILYPKISRRLLFDLQADPQETRDLSQDSSTLTLQRQLFAKLRQQQQLTGDSLDMITPYPELLPESAL
ncbi:MAG: sulfatase-like hydrolase/transferase [Fuerstiella sp.]|nr:sulfatase-like hydrolase/transferase [Fuerstiella sp.]